MSLTRHEIPGDEGNPQEEEEEEEDEGMLLNLAVSSDSEAGQPSIGVPVSASTPVRADVVPENQETSSGVTTISTSVDSSSSGLPTSSSSSGGQPSLFAGQTSSSGLPTLSSTGQPLSFGGLMSSSGLPTPFPSGKLPSFGGLTPSLGLQTSSSSGLTSSDILSSSLGGSPHNQPPPLPHVGHPQDDTNAQRAPSKPCKCNCPEIAERLKHLEETVNQLVQRQTSTPKTPRGIPSAVTTSAQKYEHMKKLAKPDHLFREF